MLAGIAAPSVQSSEDFFLTLIPTDGGEHVIVRTMAQFKEHYLTRADGVMYAIKIDERQISSYEAQVLLRQFQTSQIAFQPRPNWEDLYYECQSGSFSYRPY